MASPEALKSKSTTALYKSAHPARNRAHPGGPSNKSFLKKSHESQTEKYFSAGGETNKKRESTAALYRAQTKVLQRYILPPQDIVVYLKSPRRRR